VSREVDKLKEEVALADKAKRAHTTYLGDFFAEERLAIFNRFSNADMDTDTLLNIKHAQMALDNLEQVTLSQIETGQLAQQMLVEINEPTG